MVFYSPILLTNQIRRHFPRNCRTQGRHRTAALRGVLLSQGPVPRHPQLPLSDCVARFRRSKRIVTHVVGDEGGWQCLEADIEVELDNVYASSWFEHKMQFHTLDIRQIDIIFIGVRLGGEKK